MRTLDNDECSAVTGGGTAYGALRRIVLPRPMGPDLELPPVDGTDPVEQLDPVFPDADTRLKPLRRFGR